MKVALFIVAAVLASSASAEISGEYELTSLYKSRGVSQNTNTKKLHPAAQVGLLKTFDSGVYVGTWASTGKFENANAEVDLYAGYSFSYREVNFMLGYSRYLYTNQNSWNANEVHLWTSWESLSVQSYRGTTEGVNKGDWYHSVEYKHPLLKSVDMVAGIGYNRRKGGDERFDYTVGVELPLQAGSKAYVKVKGVVNPYQTNEDAAVVFGIKGAF